MKASHERLAIQKDRRDWESVVLRPEEWRQKRTLRFQELIRKGIPSHLRGGMWMFTARCKLPRNCHGTVYRLAPKAEKKYVNEIKKDIHRTYPFHQLFTDRKGQDELWNVLRALTVKQPRVPYCQAMASVVGMLLTCMPVDHAFWMFDHLLARYSMSQLYMDGLPMVELRQWQFETLLETMSPQLSAHFMPEYVRAQTTKWFITIFACTFPLDMLMRVWDIFLNEGWRFVMQVALALMKLSQAAILKMDMDKAYEYLKILPSLIKADDLINCALAINLTDEDLNDLEAEYPAKESPTARSVSPPPSRRRPVALLGAASDAHTSPAES